MPLFQMNRPTGNKRIQAAYRRGYSSALASRDTNPYRNLQGGYFSAWERGWLDGLKEADPPDQEHASPPQ